VTELPIHSTVSALLLGMDRGIALSIVVAGRENLEIQGGVRW
jgi:hypothetical protein